MTRRLLVGIVLTALALMMFLPLEAYGSEPTPSYLSQWGTSGTGNSQFDGPIDVATDAAGNIYVADLDNDRIQKFDPSGTYLTHWGSSGSGGGQFLFPTGVTVDALGNIYVADSANDRIQKLDSSGAFVRMWGWGVQDGSAAWQFCTSSCQAGIKGSGDGQFDSPNDVATDSVGNVYVADGENTRIQKFDSSGAYLTQWGTYGSGDEQFGAPLDLAIDASDNVYVTDAPQNRIQKFDSSGAFVRMWGWGVQDGSAVFQICTSSCQAGVSGSGEGQLNRPLGLTIDASGNIYVADSFNHRIQKFDPSGTYLTSWGSYGSGDGQFITPGGVATDASGKVYAADSGNDRVQVFGPPATRLSIKAPRSVERGSKVKVTGKLKSPDTACTASQKVELTKGSSTLASRTTSMTGTYRFAIKIRRLTRVQVVYEGTLECGPSTSAKRAIKVT